MRLADRRFREFLHSIQLVLPVTLEGSRPLVERAYRSGVSSVQLFDGLGQRIRPASRRANTRRCLETEGCFQAKGRHNFADGPLLRR